MFYYFPLQEGRNKHANDTPIRDASCWEYIQFPVQLRGLFQSLCSWRLYVLVGMVFKMVTRLSGNYRCITLPRGHCLRVFCKASARTASVTMPVMYSGVRLDVPDPRHHIRVIVLAAYLQSRKPVYIVQISVRWRNPSKLSLQSGPLVSSERSRCSYALKI